MKELWTGQAVLSHLALNCYLDLEPSQMLLCTALCIMTMHMNAKFQVILTYDDKESYAPDKTAACLTGCLPACHGRSHNTSCL